MTKTRKRGRPRKPLDLDRVERLAAFGCTIGEVASVLEVSSRTLLRRAKPALERGRAKMTISLRRAQLRAARRGDTRAPAKMGAAAGRVDPRFRRATTDALRSRGDRLDLY